LVSTSAKDGVATEARNSVSAPEKSEVPDKPDEPTKSVKKTAAPKTSSKGH
jgi:hypothetical protein